MSAKKKKITSAVRHVERQGKKRSLHMQFVEKALAVFLFFPMLANVRYTRDISILEGG